MRSALGAVTLSAIVGLNVFGSDAPWKMNVEERIRLRTDSQLARGRAAESQAFSAMDAFNGKDHPELFLPTDAFRSLLKQTFLAPPRHCEVGRERLQPHADRLELHHFWSRLAKVSSAYLATQREERDVAMQLRSSHEAGRDGVGQRLRAVQQAGCECACSRRIRR